MDQQFQQKTMASSNFDENFFELQNKEMKVMKVGIKKQSLFHQRNRLNQKQHLRQCQLKTIQNKKISKNQFNILDNNIQCYIDDENKNIQVEMLEQNYFIYNFTRINLNNLEQNEESEIEEINSKLLSFSLEEQNQQVFKMFGIKDQQYTFNYFNSIKEEY